MIFGFSSHACSNNSGDLNVPSKPLVIFETSLGDLTIELYPEKAPITVKNFLEYTKNGFYDNTIFHRVIPNFVVQGGGFAPNMVKKETAPPIKNEASNGLKNEIATLSMARTEDPNSASSQFFINLADNAFLDHKDKSTSGYGYAVFAKVIDGMSVVNAMQKEKTGIFKFFRDVPVDDIVIKKAYIKTQ